MSGGNATRRAQLAIGGMRCAACSQLIEFRLQQLPGVARFDIDLLGQQAKIEYDASQTSLRQMVDAIGALGYRALPLAAGGAAGTNGADSALAQESKAALWRLFVAGFAMMQVMMLAFPAYLQPVPQIDGELTPDIDHLLKLASLVLTVPVMLFASGPFFASAWRDWQNRHIGMDVPVALGIGFTFVASVWATFAGGPVYYDSTVMFVFLLLGARWLEARVQARASHALRALSELAPPMAERYRQAQDGQAEDGQATQDGQAGSEPELIPASAVQVGDRLRVRPGSTFPVDGVVLVGEGYADEALMSGESHPCHKTPGSQVWAGSGNLSGVLQIRAEQVGSATRFAGLLDLMGRAAQHKPQWVQLANRHASHFLLAVLLLAAGGALVWWQIEPGRAFAIAISVMVVTCPCALSLATPGVMAAAIGQLARHGVLLMQGRALEALAHITHVVFDKTGTLTTGQLQVVQQNWRMQPDPASHAQVLAHLAAASLHPVAQAVLREIQQTARQTVPQTGPVPHSVQLIGVSEQAGQGVEGSWRGRVFRFGRIEYVAALSGAAASRVEPVPDLPALEAANLSLVAFGDASGILAWFGLQDQVRPDCLELVAQLRAEGKQVSILSGDRPEVVAALAAQLGIADAHGALSPQQKYQHVQALQQRGARVAMVGDGMNDGPVLALADVSIAMGQGAPLAQAKSDLVLHSNNLADLQYAFGISRMAWRLIRQNLLWALLYNLIAIPAALGGMLTPWQAALGMSASSLLVVGNALRLLRNNAPAPTPAPQVLLVQPPQQQPMWQG
jgi:Cu2+-exporting ATPase